MPTKSFYNSIKEKLFGRKKSYLEVLAEITEKASHSHKDEKFLTDLVNKGIHHFELADTVNPIGNYEYAIECFQRVIDNLNPEFSEDANNIALNQTNIAIARIFLSKHKDWRNNLEEAYRLLMITSDYEYKYKHWNSYGTTQQYLGDYYFEISKIGNKVENCQKAISYYLSAQKVYTLEQYPQQYAFLKNKLSLANSKLG